MPRQLYVANHYQALLRFYYDKLSIRQRKKQLCRKRHDLVHDKGKILFEMRFRFQNVRVLKCERFRDCFFPFSEKRNFKQTNICEQKSVQSLQRALLMRLC